MDGEAKNTHPPTTDRTCRGRVPLLGPLPVLLFPSPSSDLSLSPFSPFSPFLLKISRLAFEEAEDVIALETSLNYVIDTALASIFDNRKAQQLDQIPQLVEQVIGCLCGLTSSAHHLKASYQIKGKALPSVTIDSDSKLTAVLELINELDAISTTGKQRESKELTALKVAIKRLDDEQEPQRRGAKQPSKGVYQDQ